ncbi:MAG: glutamine synthetase III [Lachnospiraceae bacterium]|nr:glutamine synthetase III [Lachnospiraceae bacterium]
MEQEIKVTDIYGGMVFNDKQMKERLPKDVYKTVVTSAKMGEHLHKDVADVVAAAMKEWAIELGATHFTHWFQPMTGLTAEKHDSFLSPTSDGQILMEFSGKELIKGEPDASSFPSGGLRATFEARGYTAWDPSSPAFVKDKTLYIPTAFCSYKGEALDKKTPLLRSMDALSKAAVDLLHVLGKTDVKHVDTTVGSEQEYFLIDKDLYKKRKDLVMCGRTLIGANAPKGQEMEDHYFGVLKPKVSEFMHELDKELWELGIPAKTKHNEVAPAQHELAPVFETANIAVDHNQLTMEIMKKVADKFGYACLLHEKPFAGINGSGKHNNWSISTDTGENLLNPGKNPAENKQFILFLMAVIAAVDDYQELLRLSVATAGNDHRLGANEAPPAIISVFLGDDLAALLNSIEAGEKYSAEGDKKISYAHVLPHITMDNTDRNRTSPFAFTGNKFEFRAPGSSLSVAQPNIALNAAVADELKKMTAKLSSASKENLDQAIDELVKEMLSEHKKIIFNGNGYTDEWVAEAEKRGLLNLKSVPEAVPYLISDKVVNVMESNDILSKEELESRYEIYLDNYNKALHIEALTLLDMVKKEVSEGVISYSNDLSDSAIKKSSLLNGSAATYEKSVLAKLDEAEAGILKGVEKLEADIKNAENVENTLEAAKYYHDTILSDMDALRECVDLAESITPGDYFSYPTYDKLLFSLR